MILNKPYTAHQRADFIVEANKLGYVVTEYATYLEALPVVKSLEEVKAEKTAEINTAFIDEIEVSGTLISSIDNFVIDARRVDVQNIQGLIDTYTKPTIFMGKNDSRPNTNLSELNIFKQELIKKGQELYYKKWQKLEEVKNATLETIGDITWN